MLNEASVAQITYDAKTHTLTWRCPLKPGVAKDDAAAVAKRLQAYVIRTVVQAGLVTGKQLDLQAKRVASTPARG